MLETPTSSHRYYGTELSLCAHSFIQLDMVSIQLQRSLQHTTTGLPYQHLHIHNAAVDGILDPSDLRGLSLPTDMIWSQGVVIEGRAPIWLYGYLIHACHPAVWVACFDPRLGDATPYSGGAVVVATHCHEVVTGEVLKVELPPNL
jgi:CRISPR-associated protein Csx3